MAHADAQSTTRSDQRPTSSGERPIARTSATRPEPMPGRGRSSHASAVLVITSAVYCSAVVTDIYATVSFTPALIAIVLAAAAGVAFALAGTAAQAASRNSLAPIPVLLGAIAALLTTSGDYMPIGFAALLHVAAIASAGAVVIAVLALSRSRPRRATALASVVSITVSILVSSAIPRAVGQAKPDRLTDEQLLAQVAADDMQRRWEIARYMAFHRPDLLAQATVHPSRQVSKNAVEAVEGFAVQSAVLSELQHLIREDPEGETAARAMQIAARLRAP